MVSILNVRQLRMIFDRLNPMYCKKHINRNVFLFNFSENLGSKPYCD